jgi:hypothetical protein
MRRTALFILSLSLAFLLSACAGAGGGGGGGGGGSGTSTLSTIGGPVLGYPYNSSAVVQGYAIEDGAQLASGTLVRAGTSTSFTANLTAINLVPASAFVNPFFCNNVVVAPSNAMTTGIFILGVADSGGLFGVLANGTPAPNATAVTTNDRIYVYVLADRATTVNGNCVDAGTSTTLDLTLKRGWNRVEGSFTLIDAFGSPIALTWRVTESTANNVWAYGDLGPLGASSEASSLAAAINNLVRMSFNVD